MFGRGHVKNVGIKQNFFSALQETGRDSIEIQSRADTGRTWKVHGSYKDLFRTD